MLRSSNDEKLKHRQTKLATSGKAATPMHVSNREMGYNGVNDVGLLGKDRFPDERFMTSSSVTSSNSWSQVDELGDFGQFDSLSNTSPVDLFSETTNVAQQEKSTQGMKAEASPTDISSCRKSPGSCKSEEHFSATKMNENGIDLCINMDPQCENSQTSQYSQMSICQGCDYLIEDQYLLNIGGFSWHESCAKCVICRLKLQQSCFFSDGQLYCKKDYQQTRKKCSGCGSKIESEELVMRVATSGYVYHVGCFACVTCKRLLRKGDEFVMNRHNEKRAKSCTRFDLQCKNCWSERDTLLKAGHDSQMIKSLPCAPDAKTSSLPSPGVSSDVTDMTSPKSPHCVLSPKSDDDDATSSDDESTVGNFNSSKDDVGEDGKRPRDNDDVDSKDGKRSKRPRTILNAVQRRAFKAAFEVTPKPCRKVRETLAKDTGLTVRVVQVWFQNQRAKMKKLAKRQQSQEAAAQKAREEFGYHVFDQMGSMPHQIQHMMPGSEGMMEKMFGQFHHQQVHGQINGRRMGVPWDQHPNDAIGFGQGQLYHEASGYQENMAVPQNVTITSQMDGMIPQPMRIPLNHNMTPHPPAYQGNMQIHDVIHPADMHVTSSPGNHPNDVTTPIDGLYSMQNNYFSS
uniref:Transcription factor protein n=1 Tax=Ciona intestinalis TaxID=7719 RepID=Q4H389_CIOIN|nr:transcription factor protein [Ciona intestinalis]BAE06538.1 transcription factor protein [Ciona intestinalis]|eukprot:NP_001071756.1 transcription factor protein [Ciona intestinalis]